MKIYRILKITLFLLLMTSLTQVEAKIIEAPNFNYILDYANTNTLVILDIDDTLIIPKQTLGTDVWFRYQFEKHQKDGMNATDALEKTLAEWEAVRHLTEMQTVEPDVAAIIDTMQKQGVPVIALTTQGLALATRTIQHLESLNIKLGKTSPIKEDYYFMNDGMHNSNTPIMHNGVLIGGEGHQGALFRQGILFTAGSCKATALAEILTHFCLKPETIVFINDKESHLKDAQEGAEKLGIAFIGLRYSFSDARIKNFRPEIADAQFKYSTFTHILSDEEAKALVDSRQ